MCKLHYSTSLQESDTHIVQLQEQLRAREEELMIAHVLALSELREELEGSQREEVERKEEQAALELTELRRDLEEEKQVKISKRIFSKLLFQLNIRRPFKLMMTLVCPRLLNPINYFVFFASELGSPRI